MPAPVWAQEVAQSMVRRVRQRPVDPLEREPEAREAAKMKAASADALTDDKERLFVYHYLLTIDPWAAALRAGYSPSVSRTKAYTWVKPGGPKPRIYDAVQHGLQRHADKLEISTERVLQGLAQLAFSNVQDFGSVDEDGEFAIDLKAVTRNQFAAVSEITSRVTRVAGGKTKGKDQPQITERVTKLKLTDKRAPLVDLGRHLGLFSDEPSAGQTVTFVIQGLDAHKVERTG